MRDAAPTADPFNLDRFIAAQQDLIDSVLAELRAGRKRTHWMWFIFPQLRGLGSSSHADYYGISSRREAQSYLDHPTLGPRLLECTRLVNAVQSSSVQRIFGSIDSIKFRSSMTLFSDIDPHQPLFPQALDKYFSGERDRLTLDLLRKLERS